MAANHGRQAIPTKLSEAQFGQFVLPHLSRGRRGPPPTLPLQRMFNYVLKALYMGCQWKMLPIETDAKGLPEIHHTRRGSSRRYTGRAEMKVRVMWPTLILASP
ncbi:transposase [Paraburkholderia sp. CNPSo 3281]|uniref:transposase n=1 Tax=Paraburkholderia sp. CNPSo 3281 TaxID=2940933 RepID=UPI0020B79464|nr:transposase [Paraburkholderia sp. CNPSo 3281]MCP3721496.1 transposase [Paraburkholderia sp. CNPSo 3281]